MLRPHQISSAKRLGLDATQISSHIQRIKSWIKSGRFGTWPAIDSCRIENNGILKSDHWQAAVSNSNSSLTSNFIGFIPAAGASSRYFLPIDEIVSFLRQSLNAGSAPFPNIGDLSQLPIPESLRSMLNNLKNGITPQRESIQTLLDNLARPKGLQHCTLDGLTFVEAKLKESESIGTLSSQCFIVPTAYMEEFKIVVTRGSSKIAQTVMDQGPSLCTIRTDENGDPIANEQGDLSVVPAGHGALLSLLNRQSLKTSARSAFIRNVDNVLGASKESAQECQRFLAFHNFLLAHLENIRIHLRSNELDFAEQLAAKLLRELSMTIAPSSSALASVQSKIFHTPNSTVREAFDSGNSSEWLHLFSRQLSVMGMVPNTGRDVGGTPMFVRHGDKQVKICLEVPHASPEDRKKYFEDPTKATHFNPVFCAFELSDQPLNLELFGKDFWIVAQKKFEGKSVLYHESILYELISNSQTMNCVFVEIPRALFNPHKDIRDAAGKSSQDWGFTPPC